MRERNATALKEWSSVVEALKTGRQIILLRKGGLADKGKVFAVEDSEFFLYPSYVHQQVDYVRHDFLDDFARATTPVAPEGQVRFDCYAVVHQSIAVDSEAALLRLAGQHIWNDDFIRHRLQWKPDHPAWVVLLRAYALAQPVLAADQKRYHGCRSWFQLEDALATGHATPVLSYAAFTTKAAAVQQALAGHALRA
ncbi:MAG: DUF1802 family protein [Dehalococcoidia bacterium]|nr:DUF1802 family protein [Dehalococcoidia bacterium]